MELSKRQKEVLTKARQLHSMLETHPYMFGLITERMRNWLDDVIGNGHILTGVDKSEFRKEPTDDAHEYIRVCGLNWLHRNH